MCIKVSMHVGSGEGYLEDLGVSGIKDPTQCSHVSDRADSYWGQHDDFEDTAEVYDDFDGMAGYQAWLCTRNKWTLQKRCRLLTNEGALQIS